MRLLVQTPTQRIRCLHLQRLAKLRQMFIQLYYPFEIQVLHSLHLNANNRKLNCNRKGFVTNFAENIEILIA